VGAVTSAQYSVERERGGACDALERFVGLEVHVVEEQTKKGCVQTMQLVRCDSYANRSKRRGQSLFDVLMERLQPRPN